MVLLKSLIKLLLLVIKVTNLRINHLVIVERTYQNLRLDFSGLFLVILLWKLEHLVIPHFLLGKKLQLSICLIIYFFRNCLIFFNLMFLRNILYSPWIPSLIFMKSVRILWVLLFVSILMMRSKKMLSVLQKIGGEVQWKENLTRQPRRKLRIMRNKVSKLLWR